MESRYVDVFISHKMEDAEKAQRLKRRIESFGLTCWIDADDEEMERIQKALPVDYKALTDRIREHLRTCRCLIFAFSAKSRESRWMPWELGFFDGRWGRRLIGLYDDLDEGAKENATQPAQSGGEVGIPEFLQIYSKLEPATLESFLQYVRSPRALADRADVDTDRWANLVAGIMRDPVNVSIDALQFWISYQQAFWRRALGISGLDLTQPLLGFTEIVRTAVAPLSGMTRPATPGVFDRLVQGQAEAMPQLPIMAVDGFVKLLHDASADAQQLSR